MLEVEVKIKINHEIIVGKLEGLGYVKGTTVYEKDTYYNSAYLDLKREDKALRIREHRDVDTNVTKYVLNYKGPKIDDITMTRDETQFEVPSFEHGNKVINGLGFFEAGKVEKVRIHYELDGIRCCLDKVTDLGDFLEIEIMAKEDEYDQAVNQIKELLYSLSLDIKDTICHSYLSMLQQ